MSDDPQPRLTAANLAYELEEYHQQLEAALEHDRQLLLNASWGIIRGTNILAAIIATSWLTGKFDLGGVLNFVAGFIIFVTIFGALIHYTDRGYEGDKRKLYRLPKWQDRTVKW